MIRAVKENDLSAVMQIWLDINIKPELPEKLTLVH